MSGSSFYMDWRFVLSVMFSRKYLLEASKSYIATLWVGWCFSFVGDQFYPDGGLLGVVPALAVTIVGLNAISLAKVVLGYKGVAVVEDRERWKLFDATRITIYTITMITGFCGVYWSADFAPNVLILFLGVCLTWVNGYALVRIPHYTTAYLAGATGEQERETGIYLLAPAIALASPGIVLVAYLQVTVGIQPSYIAAFWTPSTFVSAAVPLIYFPYFTALSWDLFYRLKNGLPMPQA